MARKFTIDYIARTVSLLAVVLIGIFAIMLLFLWPIFLCNIWILRLSLVAAHTSLLILYDPYLCVHRKAIYPIRHALMPLIFKVAKSEAIKEDTDTWYVPTKDLPPTDDPKELLQVLPKRVRREIKRKLKAYERRGIRTSTEHSDHLSLYRDIPVLVDHERRAVRGTDKSLVEEFVKRFLVLFLCTSGYIDRYYVTADDSDEEKLVALSLFVGQGKVLHTWMYFCKEEEKESGIWFYQHYRMMLRAAAAYNTTDQKAAEEDTESVDAPLLYKKFEYDYVNFHVHQDFAKKCVGAKAAACDDVELMNAIYPFDFFQEPSELAIQTPLNIEGIM